MSEEVYDRGVTTHLRASLIGLLQRPLPARTGYRYSVILKSLARHVRNVLFSSPAKHTRPQDKMSADASTLPTSPAVSQNTNAVTLVRQVTKRQPLSCKACRQHKLRCDRQVPCGTCVRYHREAHCRQNPAPHRRQQQRAVVPQSGSPSHPQRRDSPIGAVESTGVSAVQNRRLFRNNEADEVHNIRQRATASTLPRRPDTRNHRPVAGRGPGFTPVPLGGP